MWFWWFLLVFDCVIPVVMILCGRWMWKHCPKEINGVMGYRTRRSMQNEETWKFAHDYAGKLWWKTGWIILVPTILVHLPFLGASNNAVGVLSIIVIVLQSVFLIGSILPTENALKNTFNDDGTRKQL